MPQFAECHDMITHKFRHQEEGETAVAAGSVKLDGRFVLTCKEGSTPRSE
jgi:hypothetical protein